MDVDTGEFSGDVVGREGSEVDRICFLFVIRNKISCSQGGWHVSLAFPTSLFFSH